MHIQDKIQGVHRPRAGLITELYCWHELACASTKRQLAWDKGMGAMHLFWYSQKFQGTCLQISLVCWGPLREPNARCVNNFFCMLEILFSEEVVDSLIFYWQKQEGKQKGVLVALATLAKGWQNFHIWACQPLRQLGASDCTDIGCRSSDYELVSILSYTIALC